MRVVIAGGGTAGHVFPALAFAEVLVREHGAHVSFVGTAAGQEAELVPAAGFEFVQVESRPLARRLSIGLLGLPLVLVRSIRRAGPLVREADVVVGMGGYVSVPPVVAAWRGGRPVVLHEQNAVPGLANRWLSRVARTTALSFADSTRRFPRRARTVVTGNPIRERIVDVPRRREELAARGLRDLGLEPGRRTVVVFGGSQGALHVNRAAIGACTLLRDRSDLQVLILTGKAHHDAVARGLPASGALLVRTMPFLDRMEHAYALADLVVCRAGATTVAEVTACGIPSILVPYPYATAQHQEANARAVQRAGGASLMLDDQLTPESLAERIVGMIDHEERLRAMALRASGWGRPEAARRMADLVAETAGSPAPHARDEVAS